MEFHGNLIMEKYLALREERICFLIFLAKLSHDNKLPKKWGTWDSSHSEAQCSERSSSPFLLKCMIFSSLGDLTRNSE